MKCANCGHEASAEDRFCSHCGSELLQRCRCGYSNSADARYCGGCGTGLGHVNPSTERGERRQLTVLFCDLVGSTRLSQQLDPEDLQEVLARYQRTCERCAADHHGHVAQFLGDGIIIYFGYPHAQENDAIRAIRCGLELIRCSGEIEVAGASSGPLAARVGIHTGEVVVAPLQPGDHQWLAHGDAANVAARLQTVGTANDVVVSGTTWRLVDGSFLGRSLGEIELKGVLEPVAAWVVERETGADERLDVRRNLSPYVGRDAERRRLFDAWDTAKTGESRWVVLRSDPGMGKSRLGRLMRERAEAGGGEVLFARATPDTRNQTYHPLVRLLERHLNIPVRAEPGDRFAALTNGLHRLNVDDPLATAVLAPLLGIRHNGLYTPAELSATRVRNWIFEVLAEMLRTAATRRPVLFLFEDLHWCDASTSELLEDLTGVFAGVPILGFFTARVDLDLRWGRETGVETVELARLERPECEAIAKSVAGGKAIPPRVLRQIIARSDGVPLFVEEVTRAVLESGVLKERSVSWELVGSDVSVSIPPAIRATLASRVDRLGTARETAQFAATIGREFSVELLIRASGRSEAVIRADLRRLVTSGLAWSSLESGFETYVFKHSLVRDAAYESLLKATRKEYHLRIAQVLGDTPEVGGVKRLDLVAFHLTMGESYGAAVELWELAGHDALRRAAILEAAESFRNAIRCISLGEPLERPGGKELELQIQLMTLLTMIHGWASEEVEAAAIRGAQLALELKRLDMLYIPRWCSWSVHFLRGNLDTASELAEEVFGMATAAKLYPLTVSAHHAVAYTHLFRGELDRALTMAEAGLQTFDLKLERELAIAFQSSSSVALLHTRAVSLWMSGRVREATETWERMLRLGRALEHRSSLATALAFHIHGGCIRYSYPRRMDELSAVVEELAVRSREDGFHLWYAIAETIQGVIALARGDERGRSRMLEGRELYLNSRARVTLPTLNATVAEALYDAGEEDEPLRLLKEAEVEMERGNQWFGAPEIHRIRGNILQRRTDVREAERSFLTALRLAQKQQVSSLALRAALDLHQVLSRSSRSSDGRAVLSGVFSSTSWDFDEPEPARAKAILAGAHPDRLQVSGEPNVR